MAGIVLTKTQRELAKMGDKNFLELRTATGKLKETQALNADLRAKIALMQKSIDVLTDQRTTAEGQIKRLLDLLERTQAQRDAAMSIVNVARQSRGRLVRAYRKAMALRSDAGYVIAEARKAHVFLEMVSYNDPYRHDTEAQGVCAHLGYALDCYDESGQ